MRVLSKIGLAFYAMILLPSAMNAADPMATKYDMRQCEGSLTPYPQIESSVSYPDTLVPVFINHVGRHGSRYPASSVYCLTLQKALAKAEATGTITALGRNLQKLNNEVIALSNGRWGALDSLGMAEQANIATRMYYNYTKVFSDGAHIKALSSYSPRSMMSMFSFVHQLDRMNNRLSFSTSTGRENSSQMRPFDVDKAYLEFTEEKPWKETYDNYFNAVCPVSAIHRVLGEGYEYENEDEEKNLAITEYYVIAGLPAMSLAPALATYFTVDEANALWSCFNLRQYLQRTASTISTVPADIASDLLLNLIETTDAFVNGEDSETVAVLRFGHGETVLPIVSLLRLPGCYYLTNYFDTVAGQWCDFDVIPMAANLQLVVFKAVNSGKYYVRLDLNEKPMKLRKGDDEIYYPWGEVRRYMTNCIPLYAQ
ncbi:MAG: hypothetical protein J1F05_07450 [Muribaculaceae bacterium]|nr:hypothetical protein [Muribaculaceae bacterium]